MDVIMLIMVVMILTSQIKIRKIKILKLSAYLGGVCVQNSKELLGSSLTYKNVLWHIFAASGNYMTLVYIICLTPYLVSEHLNYALRSVIKYELCTAKRSHFVNRTYSGDFLSWNCLLICCKARGRNSNI